MDTLKTYIPRPVQITAIQYTEDNLRLIDSWTEGRVRKINGELICETLNGVVNVKVGDYIIYNELGDEFYPCNKETFEKKYMLFEE